MEFLMIIAVLIGLYVIIKVLRRDGAERIELPKIDMDAVKRDLESTRQWERDRPLREAEAARELQRERAEREARWAAYERSRSGSILRIEEEQPYLPSHAPARGQEAVPLDGIIIGEGSEVVPEDLDLKTEFRGDPDLIRRLTSPLERKYLHEWHGITMPLSAIGASAESIQKPIVVTDERRARHLYIVGSSGVGKSKALRFWIQQDLSAGRALGLIDPHGDLVREVIRDTAAAKIPPERVIIVDPTDRSAAVAFNPLEAVPGMDPAALASELVLVFKKVWELDEATAPRMLRILRHSLVTLIVNDRTLLDLRVLLTNPHVRRELVGRLPVGAPTRDFWESEFDPLPAREQAVWTESTLNKVDAFLFDPRIVAILGQRESRVDLRRAMDEQMILLVNLAKGELKDSAFLLGALLVAKIQMAAMSRGTAEPRARTPWTLYVDEFQNFATDSFTEILSEARKYGLRLVLAHQNLGQLTDSLRRSVLANAETQIYFRLNAEDAQIIVPEAFEASGRMAKLLNIETEPRLGLEGWREAFSVFDEHGRRLFVSGKVVEEWEAAHGNVYGTEHPLHSKALQAELRALYEAGKLFVRDPITKASVRARDWFPPLATDSFYPSRNRDQKGPHSYFDYTKLIDGRYFLTIYHDFLMPAVKGSSYYSVQDELTAYAGHLVNLRPRQAVLKIKGEKVYQLRTREVVEPAASEDEVAAYVGAVRERVAAPMSAVVQEMEARRAGLRSRAARTEGSSESEKVPPHQGLIEQE